MEENTEETDVTEVFAADLEAPDADSTPDNQTRDVYAFGTNNMGINWIVIEGIEKGIYNGYFGIPSTHPWAGVPADDIWELIEESDLTDKLEGGAHAITFENNGWYGFDTMHYGDIWPDSFLSQMKLSLHTEKEKEWGVVWTPDKVVEQVKIWADIAGEALKERLIEPAPDPKLIERI